MTHLPTHLNNPAYTMANLLKVAAIVALLISTSGCLYRQDVQQGNEITREMVDQVRPGMTKREVIKVLGFPLINDPFNKDRWDYFYSLKKGLSKKPAQQSVTLQFNGDLLQSMKVALPKEKTQES